MAIANANKMNNWKARCNMSQMTTQYHTWCIKSDIICKKQSKFFVHL